MRVTIKDCETQTFRVSGAGGQHRDKTSNGVRIIHLPSGARGESREERSQLQNKRIAFRRMAESDKFQRWALGATLDIPESSSTERIRTYNLIEKRVTDHRTKDQSSQVQAILDGDIDLLYK
jgi:protein subunit release factor A